jgi:hypothetical protein
LPAKERWNLQLIFLMSRASLRRQATMIIKLATARSVKLRVIGVQATSFRCHLPQLRFARLLGNHGTGRLFGMTRQAIGQPLEQAHRTAFHRCGGTGLGFHFSAHDRREILDTRHPRRLLDRLRRFANRLRSRLLRNWSRSGDYRLGLLKELALGTKVISGHRLGPQSFISTLSGCLHRFRNRIGN